MLPTSLLSLLLLCTASAPTTTAAYLPDRSPQEGHAQPRTPARATAADLQDEPPLPHQQRQVLQITGPHESGRDIERARKRSVQGSKEEGFLRLPVMRHHREANNTVVGSDGKVNETATATLRRRGPTKPRALTAASPTQTVGGYPFGWAALNDYSGVSYLMEVDIGTPSQSVNLIIDMGSYETWVSPNCPYSPDPATCKRFGTYDPLKSTTAKLVSAAGTWQTQYGTGQAIGGYWNDTMYVALEWVPGVQFAVATDSRDTWAGIVGLGYGYPYTMNYPSLLQKLVQHKIIGEITFGAINTWKYTGTLEPIPIWPPIKKQNPNWIQYWINVTSVGMTPPGDIPHLFTGSLNGTFRMPVILDVGSTLSYVRADLVALMGKQFGATIDDQGNYIVDCAWMDKHGTIDWGFNKGHLIISVSYHDFIWEQYPGRCWLGIQPADAGSTNYILGNTFLRATYLVVDQTSDTIYMQQYYNCGDGVNIVGSTKDIVNSIGSC